MKADLGLPKGWVGIGTEYKRAWGSFSNDGNGVNWIVMMAAQLNKFTINHWINEWILRVYKLYTSIKRL